jgi:exopolysaccharide biosynthesis polyprenyl glycosylphosphotransferase
MFAIDIVAALTGVSFGAVERFGAHPTPLTTTHTVVILLVPVAWWFCIAANRGYEARFLGAGTIEFERVGRAFLHFVALTTFVAYSTKAELSRGFVLMALPMTVLLSVAGRCIARTMLHRRRRTGRATIPVLAVGDVAGIAHFSKTLQLNEHSGLRVVAACIVPPTGLSAAHSDGATDANDSVEIPVVGDVDSIRDAVLTSGARSVAVVSPTISGEKLRWISWQLEGTDTDLVVLPGLTEVAGRRLDIQRVGEVPMLYVAEPEFRGVRRIVKGGFDRASAAMALILLSPLLLGLAVAIRVSSSGPALFAQTRVGKDGRTFRMLKFRSMCKGADRMKVELQESNDFAGGTLFKMRADPRVTKVGRFLRRYSLDELPQLFNVLGGSMSLVGPRPPLPEEVATYGGNEVHRRLLVKPGLTGLWQVSGRSDLSWEESVRLDLRYVEGWSLTLDMVVLAKTVRAVISGSGAY